MTGTVTSEEVIHPPKDSANAATIAAEDANAGLLDEMLAWKKNQKIERAAASEKKHSSVYETICLLHHVCVAAACCYVASMGPSCWPSVLLVAGWWLYSDLYSSILHCVLDDPKCLDIPGVAPVARGFQDHHKYPMESTAGKGLHMLCDDTVRIQWITGGLTLLFSRKRDYTTYVMILLKWLTCAYGTQVGHYYAHCVHIAPWPVKVLQKAHILLPPVQHWQHHKSPYEVCFGIVNGLTNHHLNPVYLRRVSFHTCLGLWCFLTAFDIAMIEQVFRV